MKAGPNSSARVDRLLIRVHVGPMLAAIKKDEHRGDIAVSEASDAQARLEQAVSRLSGALERINDGVTRVPEPAAQAANPEAEAEVAALRARVEMLEAENQSLRTAGRLAAEGIGETISALQGARN